MNFAKNLITKIFIWEAKIFLSRKKPKIIGITGSVGKSSTKEAVATVLGSKYSLRKNQKSYNSELGLSLAVLGLETAWRSPIGWLQNIRKGFLEAFNKERPKFLVLEMGVDRPKDLEKLLKIARPDVAVVTAIGEIPVHVEFFSGPEEVAREKSKIIKILPAGAHAFLNSDDDAVSGMRDKTKANVISFGFDEHADIKASNYKILDEGINFKVDFANANIPVKLRGTFGKHHVYPALAAIGVGNIFGINLIDSATALSVYNPLPGRLRLLDGVKNSKILDDSYNASPLAAHAALDTLLELEAKRKIVAFGDMLEIGKWTIEAHKAVGRKAAKITDIFIAVGPRAKFAAEEAIFCGMEKKNVVAFSTSREAADYLKPIIQEGDIVLVKGSQSVRMERVVLEVMAEPERAGELLCRQDEYWLSHSAQ